MKRKSRSDKIFVKNVIEMIKEGNGVVFEIGNEITSDLAEAVSILMRKTKWDDPIWNTEIDEDLICNITPKNSLFWLTGGNEEWNTLNHYNKPWKECYLEFQEEFGFMIIGIVKKSKNLKDVRDGFMRYLSLPVLYDFAISRGMIK